MACLNMAGIEFNEKYSINASKNYIEWIKAKENSKKIASVLNFPTFSFVYEILVIKNI